MHDPDSLFWLTTHLSFLLLPSPPVGLLAYVGLGPGPEFIPYFVALLSFAGAAFIALIQWPILRFLAWLRAKRQPTNQAEAALVNDTLETPSEATNDRP